MPIIVQTKIIPRSRPSVNVISPLSSGALRQPSLPPPPYVGLPPKFTDWRPWQDWAIVQMADTKERFVLYSGPTGSGKSPSYIAVALLLSLRTLVLTGTKGLQDQLTDDFGPGEEGNGGLAGTLGLNVVDIRGQNGYRCVEAERFGLSAKTTVDEGPCHYGGRCALKEGGCLYFDQVAKAKKADIVITNYAYWLKTREQLGEFGMIVLDEAHEALDHLCDSMKVEMEDYEAEAIMGGKLPRGLDREDWQNWAGYWSRATEMKLDMMVAKAEGRPTYSMIKEMKAIGAIKRKLETLRGAEGEWVTEENTGSGYSRGATGMTFSPVWPGKLARQKLFRSIPKVILTSATLVEEVAGHLGVDEGEYKFIECPHPFPVENRLVWVPKKDTWGIRMRHGISQQEVEMWIVRQDQIIGARLDRKGISHTVSFRRRTDLMRWSKWQRYMIANATGNIKDAVRRFREADPPAILVSPSVTTGWDFADSTARFSIVGKVPFADMRGAVMQARKEKILNYSEYLASQNLVQMCGRGTRHDTDWCENIIIDSSVGWLVYRHAALFPKWFLDALRWTRTLPYPPPLR